MPRLGFMVWLLLGFSRFALLGQLMQFRPRSCGYGRAVLLWAYLYPPIAMLIFACGLRKWWCPLATCGLQHLDLR